MRLKDTNKEIRQLGEEIASITLKRRKNYKCRLHDKVRAFFIKNLDVISEGLEFIEKELRIVGGDIDIVARKGQTFYLIEIRTKLSHSKMGIKNKIAQLLGHMEGLNYIISTFTNEEISMKLVFVEYVRDKEKLIVRYISNSGEIENIRRLDLKVD